MPDEVKVKSVSKAMDVLTCFTKKQPLGVTEISEILGLYKSNVHAILSTLVAKNYVEQDKETGKYYLGFAILKLSNAIGDRFSFHNVAAPYMQTLADEVNEVVYLTVPLENQVYYLDAAFPSTGSRLLLAKVRDNTDLMHCTSSGKAMLAFWSEEKVNEYLKTPLKSITENTITDSKELRVELVKIRALGYATDNMEAEVGISCVGVPILSSNDEVLGALSISGPSQRLTNARIQQLVTQLKRSVKSIQERL